MFNRIERALEGNSQLWSCIALVTTFCIAYNATVSYVESDPQGSLLTSQAILARKTIKLDAYASDVIETYIPPVDNLVPNTGRFRLHNGHVYYFFPIGPSLYSLPFVWLARLRGMNMIDPGCDSVLQNFLSALSCSVAFLLVLIIARQRFAFAPSFLLSLAFVLGGPLISTMGSALWNVNYAVLFTLGGLLTLVRAQTTGKAPNPIGLGFLLFSAYVCRPTLAIYVVGALVYIFYAHRAVWSRLVATLIALGALFVFLSMREYGLMNPPYYSIRRIQWMALVPSNVLFLGAIIAVLLGKAGSLGRRKSIILATTATCLMLAVMIFSQSLPGSGRELAFRLNIMLTARTLKALYGNLLSPGRGLLVYSPLLILGALGMAMSIRRLVQKPLFLFTAGWFLMHLLVISRPYRWYGGHCYGSRFFTELFPGILVLILLVAEERPWVRFSSRTMIAWVALGASVIGIFFNSFQGLYNRATTQWNLTPDTDRYPEYLFSWRYPQFLANPRLNQAKVDDCKQKLGDARIRYHRQNVADGLAARPYHSVGGRILADSPAVVFEGWGEVQMGTHGNPFRQGRNGSAIWLKLILAESPPDSLILEFDAAAVESLPVSVRINGRIAGKVIVHGLQRATYEFLIPKSWFGRHIINDITFETIEAVAEPDTTAESSLPEEPSFRLWCLTIKEVT